MRQVRPPMFCSNKTMAQAFPHRKYYYDFDPRSIGGCLSWFDGSDSNSIIYDTSGLVSAWLDKSGTNRHLTQSDPNRRPGYRLSGVDISSVNQRLDTSGSVGNSNYEFYAMTFADVSRAAGTFQTLAWTKNNQRLFSICNVDNGTRLKIAVGLTNTVWAAGVDVRCPSLIAFNASCNTLNVNARVNGCQSTTTSLFTTTTDISGIGNDAGTSPFGVINEILIYKGTHTIQQRRFIEGYLAHKWRATNVLEQPSQGFLPTDISGCNLWLDANDTASFDLSGSASNSVWRWKDKTSNGWDVSQGNSSLRPVYISSNDEYRYVQFVQAGTPYLLFNLNFMSNTCYSRTFGVFAVTTRGDPNISLNAFFGATANSTRNQMFLGYMTQLTWSFNGDNLIASNAEAYGSNAFTVPYILYADHNSSGFEKRLFSNGLFLARRTTGSNLLGGTNPNIGYAHYGLSSNSFTGRVCEVIFYNRILPASDIQRVHAYLMNKWNIAPPTPFLFPNHEFRLIRNPVVREFVPSDIRNCILWLDAADPTSYTLSNNVLTSWRDKSSNRNDPTDICGSPIYTLDSTIGKYGFYFDKPSYARGNAVLASNCFTSFLVASIDASSVTRGRIFGVTGRQDVSDVNDVSGIVFVAKSATSNRVAMLKGSTSERCPADCSWNTPKIIFSGYDAYSAQGGQLRFIVNGVEGQYSGGRLLTVFSTSKYTVMGSPGCNVVDNGNGTVFEALIYNSMLNYPEIEQVNNYLARKWNITDVSSELYRAQIPPSSIGTLPNLNAMDILLNQNRNCILWLDALDTRTYSVSNNAIVRLESKGVYGGSLTTSLGASYLPGYDATGLNGRPCFTTTTGATGSRLYGSYGYRAVNWGTTFNFHTVLMVVQPSSNVDVSGRLFSSFGGSGDDSTVGTGFAIRTNSASSPFNIGTLRFSRFAPTIGIQYVNYRDPSNVVVNTPTIISYNGSNDGGSHTPTTWAIGSIANTPTVTTGTWGLKVGEVLVFQNALQATDIQRMEGFLARKWGIDLCTNHTYKYVRP